MTVVVTVKCRDGVVIGSDSMLTHTSGNQAIGSQKATKIQILQGNRILGYAGTPGFAQRTCALAEQLPATEAATHHMDPTLNLHAALRSHLSQSGVSIPAAIETVYAYPAQGQLVCSVSLQDLQPFLLDDRTYFYALGSGSFGALPFLRFLTDIFCVDGAPSLQLGRFLTAWAITFACNKTPRFCALPMQMAVLGRNAAGMAEAVLYEQEDLQEHADFINSAEDSLREFARGLTEGPLNDALAGENTTIPEAPKR